MNGRYGQNRSQDLRTRMTKALEMLSRASSGLRTAKRSSYGSKQLSIMIAVVTGDKNYGIKNIRST